MTMGQSPNGACYTDNPNDAVLVQGNADLKDGWVSPRAWTTEVTKTAKAGDLIMSVRAPVGAMGKTAYDVVLGRGVYLKKKPKDIGRPFPLVRLLILSMEMNSGIRWSIVLAASWSVRRLATACLRLTPSSPFISVSLGLLIWVI